MPKKSLPIETVPLSSIKEHPRNYREHPPDQIEHLVQSIEEHGLYHNIVIAKEGTILVGHGVTKALRQMGRKTVPVIRLNLDPDNPLALKVLTGDNEIEHLAEQDDRRLADLLKEIYEEDEASLLGTGFDPAMLAGLVFVTRPASEIENHDAAAHWVGMPEFETIDVRPTLTIQFPDEEARSRFVKETKLKPTKHRKTWSAWYPPKARNDPKSLKYEEEEAPK